MDFPFDVHVLVLFSFTSFLNQVLNDLSELRLQCAFKDSDVTHLPNSEVRAEPFQATGYVQKASLDWFAEVVSCGDV